MNEKEVLRELEAAVVAGKCLQLFKATMTLSECPDHPGRDLFIRQLERSLENRDPTDAFEACEKKFLQNFIDVLKEAWADFDLMSEARKEKERREHEHGRS